MSLSTIRRRLTLFFVCKSYEEFRPEVQNMNIHNEKDCESLNNFKTSTQNYPYGGTIFFIFIFFLLSLHSIRYHGSSSSIKFHVYHHVGERRHTPVVCNERREPHTSHYPSRPVTKISTNKLLKSATIPVDW